ncbi:MAG: TIGR00159 family protein, partial [Bacteroidota bacterium]
MDIGPEDFVDIALVAVLLYQAYQLIKGTMAVRAFIGFLLLYLVYLVVKATGMELLTAILGRFMEVGVLAAIVLFQQEIRKFLFFVGSTTTPHGQNF